MTDWYQNIPKTEIHLHLEGAIPHDTLFELVKKYNGTGEIQDIESLKKRFHFRDFHHFIETWIWKNSFLKEYEDFEFIAEHVLENLKIQNVIYTECFISPRDFTQRHSLETSGIIEAVCRGFKKVSGIQASLIIDLVRDFGADEAMKTLNEVFETRDPIIKGIGIGGTEDKFPPELFQNIYQSAQNKGLFTTAHAGEADGAESVRKAVELLHVTRIGHGVRAIESPDVMNLLKDRNITLEICPVSNVKTGVITKISEHPVKKFYDFGIPVTISTDDPGMFGNSLAEEYRHLVDDLGFEKKDICQMIRQGIEAAFLTDNEKKNLIHKLVESPYWIC